MEIEVRLNSSSVGSGDDLSDPIAWTACLRFYTEAIAF